jgi:hypothetical protein
VIDTTSPQPHVSQPSTPDPLLVRGDAGVWLLMAGPYELARLDDPGADSREARDWACQQLGPVAFVPWLESEAADVDELNVWIWAITDANDAGADDGASTATAAEDEDGDAQQLELANGWT